MDVACTAFIDGSTPANSVYGRLPGDASSCISMIEVSTNGVQVQQGAQEYGTICRMLNLTQHLRDCDGSLGALSHGTIMLSNAAEDVSLVLPDSRGL